MTVYIILMILALSGYITHANANEKTRKYYVSLVFGAIVLIAMLRSDQVGIDLRHYYNKYFPQFKNAEWANIQKVTISGDWELGFCAFCKIIGQISTDTQCFVLFTSLFTIIPYALFIYKNSDDVVFSTVFFLGYHIFMMSMNVIRQAMAVGIILLGLEALKRKQYMKFVIYVAAATLFHTSAIFALLFILCDKLTFKKNNVYFLLSAAIVFFAAYRFIFDKILNLSVFSDTFGIYRTSSNSGYITFHTLGMFLIAAFIFVFCCLVYTRNKLKSRPYRCGKHGKIRIARRGCVILIKRTAADTPAYWSESMIIYAVYLAALFRFTAFIINVTARLSYYFIPFLMIAFPHALNKIRKKRNRIWISFGMVVVILFFFLFLGYTRAGAMWGTVPYQFFWSEA